MAGVTSKILIVKLFYNTADHTYYVQLGENMLFRVTQKVALSIQEKEDIDIRSVEGLKAMQLADKNGQQ